MPSIPPFLRPGYKPSPPINRTYSGPAVPTAYDVNWQVYNNLTPDQIAWFPTPLPITPEPVVINPKGAMP